MTLLELYTEVRDIFDYNTFNDTFMLFYRDIWKLCQDSGKFKWCRETWGQRNLKWKDWLNFYCLNLYELLIMDMYYNDFWVKW